MHCGRCHGLMLADHFLDMGDHAGHRWLRGWRCLNCGEVVEPGIAAGRRAQRSRLARLMPGWAKRSRIRPDVVPLGL